MSCPGTSSKTYSIFWIRSSACSARPAHTATGSRSGRHQRSADHRRPPMPLRCRRAQPRPMVPIMPLRCQPSGRRTAGDPSPRCAARRGCPPASVASARLWWLTIVSSKQGPHPRRVPSRRRPRWRHWVWSRRAHLRRSCGSTTATLSQQRSMRCCAWPFQRWRLRVLRRGWTT